jgi:hypothetical protein
MSRRITRFRELQYILNSTYVTNGKYEFMRGVGVGAWRGKEFGRSEGWKVVYDVEVWVEVG